MCQKGDIILVKGYAHEGVTISSHPFVVLSDEAGQVCGLDFDLIALAMSSFKNEDQKRRKLSYPGNFPVSASEKNMNGMVSKDAYIKAEQFFYFDKASLNYVHIGSITSEAWESLLAFIEAFSEKGISIERVIDNLKNDPGR